MCITVTIHMYVHVRVQSARSCTLVWMVRSFWQTPQRSVCFTMFKFSFDGSKAEQEASLDSPKESPGQLPAKIEPATSSNLCLSKSSYDYVILCDSFLKLRKSTASPSAHLSPSGADIVPFKYEGGYKLWEGAVDLVEYLFHEKPCDFTGKKVLELGAGHALPSILAARLGAAQIDINDYNSEVLNDVTMPNLQANVESNPVKIRFFSGGWHSLPALLKMKYDIVLSAETVYTSHQSEELAKCVVETIAPDGIAFIAGKSYYFGVGGGIRAFDQHVNRCAAQRDIPINTRIVREIRDGVSNVREILQIRRGLSQSTTEKSSSARETP